MASSYQRGVGGVIGRYRAANRQEIRHQRTFDGMIDFLKPEAIPVAVSLLFASLGGLVWVAWSRQQH